MKLLAALVEHLRCRHAGCSCDVRFLGVATDVDCPLHGLSAQMASSLPITRVRVEQSS